MKKVSIPGTVKTIGENAFQCCFDITEVIIEEGVERIEDGAFSECKVLASVTMPGSITNISGLIFWRSPNVTVTAPAGSYAESYALDEDIPCVNP